MSGLKGDNPVEQLREKLARDARWRVRERYFALRIVPVLLGWALLMAAATVAAGGLIGTCFGLLYSYRAWIEAGPPEGRPEDDGGGGVDEDEDEPLHNVSDSERYILQQE